MQIPGLPSYTLEEKSGGYLVRVDYKALEYFMRQFGLWRQAGNLSRNDTDWRGIRGDLTSLEASEVGRGSRGEFKLPRTVGSGKFCVREKFSRSLNTLVGKSRERRPAGADGDRRPNPPTNCPGRCEVSLNGRGSFEQYLLGVCTGYGCIHENRTGHVTFLSERTDRTVQN